LYTYVVFIIYSSHSTEHCHIRNLHGIVHTHTHTHTHTNTHIQYESLTVIGRCLIQAFVTKSTTHPRGRLLLLSQ